MMKFTKPKPQVDLRSFIQQTAAREFVDEDGQEARFQLLPPLTDSEIQELEGRLPLPLTQDVRDLLSYTCGFAESPLESLVFSGLDGLEFPELLPGGHPIAHDGFANYWVIDLVPGSDTWGPIVYIAHDPPVMVYQAPDIYTFLEEMVKLWDPPYRGALDDVHEACAHQVWRENPAVYPVSAWLEAGDEIQREFANNLTNDFLCVDLRNAKVGDGFSWGRYGPNTVVRRHGWHRLFAYQQRKPWWQRIRGRGARE